MATKTKTSKCQCGCGQASADKTRMRKASCPCGAAVIRLTRSALAAVTAECAECGGDVLPECLIDRTYGNGPDAEAAMNELEAKHDRMLARQSAGHGGRAPLVRCGDCHAFRKPSGSCKNCGSEHAGTTSYLHPRQARAMGGDMPF